MFSILLFISLCCLIVNLIDRMNRHEQREVREILTAFLSGYKNGVFDKKEKKQRNRSVGVEKVPTFALKCPFAHDRSSH